MRDGRRTKFRKAKMPHSIWLPVAVILVEAFLILAVINANAARGIDEVERKGDMLSIAMDIRERRDDEISKTYFRMYLSGVEIDEICCSLKGITIAGAVYTDVLKEYTGMEIYRAEAAKNGEYGEFRRIGGMYPKEDERFSPVVPDIIPDDVPKESPKRYTYTYTDSKVEPGKEYAYQIYADGHRLDGKPAPRLCSIVKKAFTGSPQGKYKCSIVKNTRKKLIVKLTGESEETGLLKCRIGCAWSVTHLVYKNKLYETENSRKLQIIKYSYDGKKWHDDSYSEDGSYAMFTIRGKESIYLWLADDPYYNAHNRWKNYILEDIDFSGYRYAQMMLSDVFYNASKNCELRFNFTSGRALTGSFTQWNDVTNRRETAWDNNVFRFLCNNDGEFFDDYETYE